VHAEQGPAPNRTRTRETSWKVAEKYHQHVPNIKIPGLLLLMTAKSAIPVEMVAEGVAHCQEKTLFCDKSRDAHDTT